MAIVNILAEKSDFIGLRCWLKLLCVNYQIASWDLSQHCCLLSLPLAGGPSRLLATHLLCALCPAFWDFVTFKSVLSLSPIITAHTEMCMRNMRLSEAEEEEEAEEATEKGKNKCDRWSSASGWWVQKGAGPGVGWAVLYSLSPLIRKCQSDCMWTSSKADNNTQKVKVCFSFFFFLFLI